MLDEIEGEEDSCEASLEMSLSLSQSQTSMEISPLLLLLNMMEILPLHIPQSDEYRDNMMWSCSSESEE